MFSCPKNTILFNCSKTGDYFIAFFDKTKNPTCKKIGEFYHQKVSPKKLSSFDKLVLKEYVELKRWEKTPASDCEKREI